MILQISCSDAMESSQNGSTLGFSQEMSTSALMLFELFEKNWKMLSLGISIIFNDSFVTIFYNKVKFYRKTLNP